MKVSACIYLLLCSFLAMGAEGDWPSFRGAHAEGVMNGQNLPKSWSAESGENILWKIKLPGLAHACPIVWGDTLFVACAVAEGSEDAELRHGLFGSGESAQDKSKKHFFKLTAINKKTGKILWDKVAREGKPTSGRHVKATYANNTPVTDGRYVVAYFGSDGLHAFTMDGEKLWSVDQGELDMGAYNYPGLEWGSASSPIIYKDSVIVQVDTGGDDYIAAYALKTGKELWKTSRDELPGWGTPTVYPGKKRTELVVNGSNFIMGYNPDNGKELWRLGGSSKITAPTPIFKDDYIVVASGRRPVKPIFVLRPGAEGDITLPEDVTESDSVVWSKTGRGPYMPTPIIVDKNLYVLTNDGIFDAYDLATGKEIYRKRIPHPGGGFSASPVAADGKIYLCAEDGEIYVIKAGDTFEQVAVNSMDEILMATPAISEGVMYVRGRYHMYAIGSQGKSSGTP